MARRETCVAMQRHRRFMAGAPPMLTAATSCSGAGGSASVARGSSRRARRSRSQRRSSHGRDAGAKPLQAGMNGRPLVPQIRRERQSIPLRLRDRQRPPLPRPACAARRSISCACRRPWIPSDGVPEAVRRPADGSASYHQRHLADQPPDLPRLPEVEPGQRPSHPRRQRLPDADIGSCGRACRAPDMRHEYQGGTQAVGDPIAATGDDLQGARVFGATESSASIVTRPTANRPGGAQSRSASACQRFKEERIVHVKTDSLRRHAEGDASAAEGSSRTPSHRVDDRAAVRSARWFPVSDGPSV